MATENNSCATILGKNLWEVDYEYKYYVCIGTVDGIRFVTNCDLVEGTVEDRCGLPAISMTEEQAKVVMAESIIAGTPAFIVKADARMKLKNPLWGVNNTPMIESEILANRKEYYRKFFDVFGYSELRRAIVQDVMESTLLESYMRKGYYHQFYPDNDLVQHSRPDYSNLRDDVIPTYKEMYDYKWPEQESNRDDMDLDREWKPSITKETQEKSVQYEDYEEEIYDDDDDVIHGLED